MESEGSTDHAGQAAEALRLELIESAQRIGPEALSTERLNDELDGLISKYAPLLSDQERTALTERVMFESLGLGAIEPLLRDECVDEVMINGPNSVFVERAGKIERTEVSFKDEQQLRHLIERVLAPLGRRVDEASPLVDARLSDGSRINCVIPPLSLVGPVMTIRRFRRHGFSADQLVTNSTLTESLRQFLATSVRVRCNMVVAGGTGSGKTTTLNALSEYIPSSERVITVEDAAELRLRQPHVVRLESRPANVEGKGEISIRDLVRNALRMRPDRIVVGEVRGGEALDMLQAMNTGHDGSLTTLHANSPQDALRRVETLALMADVGLPYAAVQQQLASAVDLVVHQERMRDGSRAVTAVVEVVGAGNEILVRELYARSGESESWPQEPSDLLGRKVSERV